MLNQEFLPDTICQKWCGDITYIHTQEDDWTYLASMMDLYSRKRIHGSIGFLTPQQKEDQARELI